MTEVKPDKTHTVNKSYECVIEEWPDGILLGQDLHMNGLDFPAFVQWDEVHVLMDLLGSILAAHRVERAK